MKEHIPRKPQRDKASFFYKKKSWCIMIVTQVRNMVNLYSCHCKLNIKDTEGKIGHV